MYGESYDIGNDYLAYINNHSRGPNRPGYENGSYKPSQAGSGDMAIKKELKVS